MKPSEQNTDGLIDKLVDHLEPVTPMKHPLWVALPWLCFAIAYIGLSIAILNTRPDFAEKIAHMPYIIEISTVFLLSLSAALTSMWLKTPDIRGQKYMLYIPLALLTFLCGFAAYFLSEINFNLPHIHWHMCYLEALIFAVIPATALIILSTKGKTTRPYMLGLMNTLTIGALGYIGLRITCASDDPGHICVYHALPYIVFALVITFIGNRIYRW